VNMKIIICMIRNLGFYAFYVAFSDAWGKAKKWESVEI